MGFVQVKAQMLKNIFTVVPTLLKLLGSMAHNDHGLLLCWHLKNGQAEAEDDI